jgi:hypothetical protein
MTDHIHTIPVLDALRLAASGLPGENAPVCPFCLMKRKLDRDAVSFIMGPAYMEEDVRMETNRRGFCPAHLKMLYAEQNRLGLGLMLHTFLQQLNRDTKTLMQKPEPERKPKLAPYLRKAQTSCYLCDRVDGIFERYIDTFFFLWKHEKEAKKLTEQIPAYCLPHFALMLETASAHLSRADRDAFLSAALNNQRQFMETLESDVEWFTLKFDYRNTDAPWKNSKDALPRAIAFLSGE